MPSISNPSIRSGSRVRLHLSIHLSDGTEALSTFDEPPLELTLGDGTLTPGTEYPLLGLTAGAEVEQIADGNHLFGHWSEDNLHWLAKTKFPDTVPQPGSLVAFATPDGVETPGIVKDIRGDQVRVDFNHPLSGRVLRLCYQILAVADPAQVGPGQPPITAAHLLHPDTNF
ncbi:MAG: peptidylprolyl isomerase [Chromatiaceae bacterium]